MARIDTGPNKAEEIHVKVVPYTFDLPRIPALTTAFKMPIPRIISKHEELSQHSFDPDELRLSYLEALAEHRISAFFPGASQIRSFQLPNGESAFDWSDYEDLTGGIPTVPGTGS